MLAWYASERFDAERSEATELELLRSSYRLGREAHERPYRLAAKAAAALGVDVPITLYQLTGTGSANAMLFFDPNHAHVGLAGPVLAWLSDDELLAILGHELAHHLLFTIDSGRHRATAALVIASASKSTSFVPSAVRLQQWTEVFCDRGALVACGSIDAAIRALLRISTGLEDVSAADYLNQAEDVVARLERTATKSASSTHPEDAVRIVGLARWHREGEAADEAVGRFISGESDLENLDVCEQRRVLLGTRAILDRLFEPPWFRTEALLAHAAAFFPGYAPRPVTGDPPEPARSAALAEYFAYVLLDFAVIDPESSEVALAHVWLVACALGLREALTTVLRKDLKMSVAAVNALDKRARATVDAAAAQRASEGL